MAAGDQNAGASIGRRWEAPELVQLSTADVASGGAGTSDVEMMSGTYAMTYAYAPAAPYS